MLDNMAEAEHRMALGIGTTVNVGGFGMNELPLPESIALASHFVDKFCERQRTDGEEDLYNVSLKCLSVFLSHSPIMCITSRADHV